MQPTPLPVRAFHAEALEVRVFSTQADLAAAAAAQAAACLRAALARNGQARAILASATSQIQFLAALTAAPDLDWSRVTLFHMDEYLGVTDEHPASFRRFLREHVLPEPLEETDRYGALLRAAPLDLCCLGIGENGHVAFNDPPVANFDDPRTVKLVQLDEPCRQQQVGEGCFPTLDAVPRYAYTLTVPTLCGAGKLVCVVPERRKAVAVRDALQGPVSTGCPASILRRQAHATLDLDAESASLITSTGPTLRLAAAKNG
jgi:glucosamine-6-phosphate deaminase